MAYAGKGISKFEFAAKLVAALAYLTLGNTEHVGLAVFSSVELSTWVCLRLGGCKTECFREYESKLLFIMV